jgi:hypothetical protein
MAERKTVFFNWKVSVGKEIDKLFIKYSFPDFLVSVFWNKWDIALLELEMKFNQVVSGNLPKAMFEPYFQNSFKKIFIEINVNNVAEFNRKKFLVEIFLFFDNKPINTGFVYSSLDIDKWFAQIYLKINELSETYSVEDDKKNKCLASLKLLCNVLKDKGEYSNRKYMTEKQVSIAVINEVGKILEKPVITRYITNFINGLGLLKLD